MIVFKSLNWPDNSREEKMVEKGWSINVDYKSNRTVLIAQLYSEDINL